jgi:hypothetical protein
VLTKQQWLGRYASGELRYDSLDFLEPRTRVYDSTAIQVGRLVQKGTHRRISINAKVRAMLVFVRQDNQWKLAGLQLSPIGELTFGG